MKENGGHAKPHGYRKFYCADPECLRVVRDGDCGHKAPETDVGSLCLLPLDEMIGVLDTSKSPWQIVFEPPRPLKPKEIAVIRTRCHTIAAPRRLVYAGPSHTFKIMDLVFGKDSQFAGGEGGVPAEVFEPSPDPGRPIDNLIGLPTIQISQDVVLKVKNISTGEAEWPGAVMFLDSYDGTEIVKPSGKRFRLPDDQKGN